MTDASFLLNKRGQTERDGGDCWLAARLYGLTAARSTGAHIGPDGWSTPDAVYTDGPLSSPRMDLEDQQSRSE